MKALVINKYWRPNGGVEEYAFQIERLLENGGCHVVPFSQREAFTRHTEYSEYFVDPVDTAAPGMSEKIRFSKRALWGGDSVQSLARLLDEVDIDFAHVMHVYHQIGPRVLTLLKNRKIPTVVSVHDYKLCCPSFRLFNDKTRSICTRCRDKIGDRHYAPATTACWKGSRAGGAILAAEATMVRSLRPYQSADLVLVSNDLMKACAIAGGIDPTRIRVLLNSWPAPHSPQPWKPGDRLLFVGRLAVEKGVDRLIGSAARTGVGVDVIGTGPMRAELEALASSVGADVKFVGAVRGRALEEAMRNSAGLVIPSIWHEVSPLVCYQALSLGVPVIASNVGGMADLLGGGRGLLYELGREDQLDRYCEMVVQASDDVATMAERGKDFWSANLTTEVFESKVKECYAEIGVTL